MTDNLPAAYSRETVDKVLEAYQQLFNDTLALNYCGITDRKTRTLILADPYYIRQSKIIQAESWAKELKDVESIQRNLNSQISSENVRFGENNNELAKLIPLQAKIAELKHKLRALSAEEKENDEGEALNIIYVAVTKEEFENLRTVEINEGSEDGNFVSGSDEDRAGAANRIAAELKEANVIRDPLLKGLENKVAVIKNPDGTVEYQEL